MGPRTRLVLGALWLMLRLAAAVVAPALVLLGLLVLVWLEVVK